MNKLFPTVLAKLPEISLTSQHSCDFMVMAIHINYTSSIIMKYA